MGRFIKEGPVVSAADSSEAAEAAGAGTGASGARQADVVPGFAPVDEPAVVKGGE